MKQFSIKNQKTKIKTTMQKSKLMLNPKSPKGESSVPYGAREILNSKRNHKSQIPNHKLQNTPRTRAKHGTGLP